MKQESIEMIVRAIDPINAKRLMQNETIAREFKAIGEWMKKGDVKGAVWILGNIRNNIQWWRENSLTPESIKVGDGVTINLYTDRHAATVTRVTKRAVTVRRDKAVLDPDFKPEYAEGSTYCTNASKQAYTYRPDPNGNEFTIYWSEKYRSYGQPDNLTLSKGRHEYYDYNF